MKKIKQILWLLLEAFKEFIRDRSKSIASGLAYSQLLAIGPLIAFIFFFTGKIWGMEVLKEEVVPLLKNAFTPQLTKVITVMLLKKIDVYHVDITSLSFYSAILFIWATKKYFGQVKQAIEVTWNKRRSSFGVIPYFKRAVKSFKVAGITTLIFILILFIRLILPFKQVNEPGIESDYWMIKISQWVTGFLIVTTIKTFYFTFIPPVKSYWKNVIPAAVLNAILFLIGREIMEVHFSERPDADVAESIIMVLLWFYYTNLIFLYSAEFNKLYVVHKQKIDVSALKFHVK